MLSDTISEIVFRLKEDIIHYTTGTFAREYEPELIERLDKIVADLDQIRTELDTPPLKQ